ncbi:hypothetical protein DCM91_18565 [Chitinophaga costaii]|nr:hypothetical protein DCM91_18565 [Chitinophaga costaii]
MPNRRIIYIPEAKDILEFNFFGVNKQWMKGRLLILLGLALFFYKPSQLLPDFVPCIVFQHIILLLLNTLLLKQLVLLLNF